MKTPLINFSFPFWSVSCTFESVPLDLFNTCNTARNVERCVLCVLFASRLLVWIVPIYRKFPVMKNRELCSSVSICFIKKNPENTQIVGKSWYQRVRKAHNAGEAYGNINAKKRRDTNIRPHNILQLQTMLCKSTTSGPRVTMLLRTVVPLGLEVGYWHDHQVN